MMQVVLLVQDADNGPVKVLGATDRTQRRVVEKLQDGNPHLLSIRAVLDGDERVERRLHVLWEEQHLGRDWYEPAVLELVPRDVQRDPSFDAHEEARRVKVLDLASQLGA